MNETFKKTVKGLFTVLLGTVCTLGAAADGIMPATGEPNRIMPFILAGAAVLIIGALVVLSFLSKKK